RVIRRLQQVVGQQFRDRWGIVRTSETRTGAPQHCQWSCEPERHPRFVNAKVMMPMLTASAATPHISVLVETCVYCPCDDAKPAPTDAAFWFYAFHLFANFGHPEQII
ncbi:MAG: hypothetical protein KDB27_35095, partial [Planctomycetales bacterium]|nr:hypothetical protein [Planctomycetales bacterium]